MENEMVSGVTIATRIVSASGIMVEDDISPHWKTIHNAVENFTLDQLKGILDVVEKGKVPAKVVQQILNNKTSFLTVLKENVGGCISSAGKDVGSAASTVSRFATDAAKTFRGRLSKRFHQVGDLVS